jgi:hypothetical protein
MSPFAETPRVFVPVSSPGKTRVYLVGHEPHLVRLPTLTQVATVTGPPELGRQLVAALNSAAWSGQTTDLDRLLDKLPDAVGQGCRAALKQCPPPASLALSTDDVPMVMLREVWFDSGSEDLANAARAAMELGLQFIFDNELDEEGRVWVRGRLLSDEREAETDDVDRWWPAPEDAQVVHRIYPNPAELDAALQDPRWHTRRARGFWLWMKDSSDADTRVAEWVIEFLDADLDPERNFDVFVRADENNDDLGFLTERTRFLLWMALRFIAGDLDSFTCDWPEWESAVRDDMPSFLRDQPQAWWRSMYRSADRLCEAARRGDRAGLVPRTPAEEALIYLASRTDYVEAAGDLMRDLELSDDFAALPKHEYDEVWDEILGELTGDVDIEALWAPGGELRADPADELNKILGMGDYRPEAWHRLFERAIPEDDALDDHK